jgi:hypothetical protein
MSRIPDDIQGRFEKSLAHESVPEGIRPSYRKWLRYYFDFCHKYQYDMSSRESLKPFLKKLAEKNQPANLKRQTSHVVSIFCKHCHAGQLTGRCTTTFFTIARSELSLDAWEYDNRTTKKDRKSPLDF